MSSPPQTGLAAGHVGVGAVLAGRYRLTARIGAGGMATVYRGFDDSLGRDVAVKVLHRHLADDEGLVARFRTEARHAAALLHPNVVNVFDQGAAELPYIVFEYVDGPSLRDVLLLRGHLPPGEALTVVEALCHGLTRAHAAGVVHRDIKPENVLIAPDGTPKVADFGIARALAATNATTTGVLIGSVHYLAPELVSGQEATPRSDQYALGVLLFELLTGAKPLPADSPMAVALRHAREPVPAPSERRPGISEELDAVVARATAPDPVRRYPNLAALAAALRHAVDSGPQPVVVRHSTADGDQTLVIPAEAVATRLIAATAAPPPSVQDTPVPAAFPQADAPAPGATIAEADATTGAVPATAAGQASKRPRRRWGRGALLPVALLVLLSAAGVATWLLVVAPVRSVPQLAGASHQQAEQATAELGLTLTVTDERTDPRAARGQVLSQDPAAGSQLRRGGTVGVVLSLGPAQVSLPDVSGRRRSGAFAALQQAPYLLEVTERRTFSDTVAAGRVIATDPEAGATVSQGDAVTVRISRGVEQVAVPEVAGSQQPAAVAALEEAGFRARVRERYSDEAPQAGQVFAQSPPPGKRVDKGSTVTLTVSLGPLTVTMPNLNGHGLRQGLGELDALGLQAHVTELPREQIGPFRRGEFGRVEAQVPEPGTPLQRGDRVELYTYSASAEEQAGG